MSSTDLAIIGAGAAGLAAAIFAAQTAREAGRPLRVTLLDGAKTLGAKILIAGGGRCNVTNERVTQQDFNGSPNIVRNILLAFDEQATVKWFEQLGVQLKREETGKLFPITDSARTVLNALLERCRQLDVEILSDHRVTAVAGTSPFVIHHSHGEVAASQLILCTGGRSLPKTGSDGAGYSFAKTLGHTVTETYPALVPLLLDASFFHASISGVSHEAVLITILDNRPIDRRTGSLLWTHFGISGPLSMDASRHWIITNAQAKDGQHVQLRCNFLPGETFEHTEAMLVSAARTPRTMSRILSELMPERLAGALLQHCGIDPALNITQLSREARRTLVHALTGLVLPVQRDRGWNYAEVTAGGVPLSEINFRNMASRKTPGLYLAGEILDCDGRIGGFNFQWAWATGHIAGRSAARALISM